MKWLLAAAIVAVGLPGVAAADDAAAGAWKMNGHVDGKDFVVNCHFDRHGDGLGGACFDGGTNLKHLLTSGSVKGDQVKWTYVSHKVMIPFDVVWVGKLSGGTMQGTVSAVGHNGTFTAAKE